MTPLKVLVTAGATEVPIDRVRAITNIFKGKTGTAIAHAFAFDWRRRARHAATLLTSNPYLARCTMPEEDAGQGTLGFGPTFDILPYRTFDELAAAMEREVRSGAYDLVIHSAAVSDYRVAGVHTRREDGALVPLDASGKVGSSHERLFLELERTPKLLEAIRRDWGFKGQLVQFKLEVGINDEELIARARAALERSGGDLCVANCLEWAKEAALLIDRDGRVERVDRAKLPAALVQRFAPLTLGQ
jgi:phosphopantothenate-cysteine ligase/phosphopantothenoylcysteine decarboxylase/phosphopantothenate--cysteine ligase